MTVRDDPPTAATVTAEEREQILYVAINGLREDHPLQSASSAMMGWQKPLLVGSVCARSATC